MPVYSFGGRHPLVSIEDLEALFRASGADLVRRFGARRVGNSYALPLQGTPWIALFDLGREYELKNLVIRGVSLINAPAKPWFSVVVGFLVGDYVVGVSLVGRRAVDCRAYPLNPPLDLWDLPRGVSFPRPLAIVSEVSTQPFSVSVPWDCLGAFGLSIGEARVRHVVAYSNLVSVGSRVFIDLSRAVVAH
jgi:hypothetical protein